MVCEYSAHTARQIGATNMSQTHIENVRFWKGDIHANAVRTVPCFFNDSYLLVEINEFNQLFYQYFLSANNLFDEHMLEQV